MEDERLQLCVCFRSKFLPVCLALRQAEMGNPITLHHLRTELHRQTGVPVGHMSFVVDGDVEGKLSAEMVRDNPDKPLFLVGIRHNTKLHMYSDTVTPYWDDENMKLLLSMQHKYGKVKELMNRTMHKVNMIRNDKKMYNTQKMTQYEKHVRPLEQVVRDITLLQSKLVELEVMPENYSKAKQIKEKMFINMQARLHEIAQVMNVIKQKRVTSARHFHVLSHV